MPKCYKKHLIVPTQSMGKFSLTEPLMSPYSKNIKEIPL